jgi:hypothetical protein
MNECRFRTVHQSKVTSFNFPNSLFTHTFYLINYQLMDILANEEYTEVISWLPHGNGFAIHKKKTFASEILPRHFKASKFTSFTRKLNRWGFTRAARGPETGAYFHKLFRRDKPELCLQMTSNSGNKYQSAPMQQHILPAVPGLMGVPPAMYGGGMPFYMPVMMGGGAQFSPHQQQALWQQQMQVFQLQQMQMMHMQQQQQVGGMRMPLPGMQPMMMLPPQHAEIKPTDAQTESAADDDEMKANNAADDSLNVDAGSNLAGIVSEDV